MFRTRIYFRDNETYPKRLRYGQKYYIENLQEVSYSDIVEAAERIINVELKPELQKYTDMSVQEVQMQSVYEGSIEIIFTVVLGFLNLIGGLKDLYDAIQLVWEISERHINKRLSDKFGNNFRVDTYAIVSRHEDYWRFEKGNMMAGHGSSGEAKRDVFFYYLLVANIILLILIGVLVFGAVMKVYYGM